MKHKSLLPANDHKAAQNSFVSKDDYEKQLDELQKQMLDLQQKVRRKKLKVVILFEGPDAAGKGGAIKRLTEYLDPHAFHVHAIGAPSANEIGENYFERFFRRLPAAGSIAIFDRSWYGRVLVERVEGLASKRDWKRAFDEINAVEGMFEADGVLILKFLLDVTFEEQKKRFKEREDSPLKNWKLTSDDWRNRSKWDEYRKAYAEMLAKTSTEKVPWHVIAADSKWWARTEVLKTILKTSSKNNVKKTK